MVAGTWGVVIEKWLETRYTSKIESKVLVDGLQMGERKKSRLTLMFLPSANRRR